MAWTEQKEIPGSPARLWTEGKGGRVKCTACARYCQIGEGQIGLCGVRGVVNGTLYLFVYGRIIASHVDPIEKKPVTHFMPGTKIFSIATTGCNWLCAYCQNFDISQRRKVEGIEVTPEEVVEAAIRYGSHGIAYTYNEPTIFIEFAHDIGVIARRRGLINVFVTNGYWTPDSVRMASEFLDAATVDFKGNGEVNFLRRYVGIPDPEPIFQTLLEIKEKTRIHIEITDLVVPEVGDDLNAARKLVRWIHDNLGPDTPVHFLRFHPDYKMMHLPWTPVETLERHWKVAKEEGMNYVYIGNVPGHPYESTYCPGCGELVVERYGFDIVEWRLTKDNRCPACGYKVAIVGSPPPDYGRTKRFVPVFWRKS
ncbi:MAG: AmmeMemoRadiSam system radical SAM enzyme [Candidatus Calditenuis sp.]|nr:AmmeMemoRadiSam system radical SAM enzyme [Candidatus Calditenuis sp.]